jgi:putative phage-type endonuclease
MGNDQRTSWGNSEGTKGRCEEMRDVPCRAFAGASFLRREDWLKERRTLLTASDCAAVLGVDPRRGPLAIYAAKVGGIEMEETWWMRWGRRVEGAIAEGYAEETGRHVVDLGALEIQRHPDIPWLGATLDRVTHGSVQTPTPQGVLSAAMAVPLELKAQGMQRKREWRDDPPLEYVIQLQIQMSCTSAQWGSLCALLGGMTIVWQDILRNDDFLRAALPRLEEFWLRVQRREPPDADGLSGTTEAIKRLWPTDSGETIALDHEALELADALESEMIAQRACGERVGALENKLRARLGSASYGALPDGTLLSLQTIHNAGYVRAIKPYDYRTLRRIRGRKGLR